jgi:hypothetical protein
MEASMAAKRRVQTHLPEGAVMRLNLWADDGDELTISERAMMDADKAFSRIADELTNWRPKPRAPKRVANNSK